MILDCVAVKQSLSATVSCLLFDTGDIGVQQLYDQNRTDQMYLRLWQKLVLWEYLKWYLWIKVLKKSINKT